MILFSNMMLLNNKMLYAAIYVLKANTRNKARKLSKADNKDNRMTSIC